MKKAAPVRVVRSVPRSRRAQLAAVGLFALLCAAAAAQFSLGGPAAGALGLAVAAAAAAAFARVSERAGADAQAGREAGNEAPPDAGTEQTLRAVFEAFGEGIVALGPDDRIRWANGAALRILGYAEAELAGLMLSDLLSESLASAPAQARRKDGSQAPVDVAFAEADLGPRRLRFVRLRDLSGSQPAEETLRRARKSEMTSELAMGVAHDFNNQLTVILAYAGLLNDALAGDDEKLRRMADSIRSAAHNAAELTRQLLAFGRRQPAEPAAVDLALLLKSMQRLIQAALGERIELVLQFGVEPAAVFIDRAELEAVVIDLAVGARKAMPDGGRFAISTAPERSEDGRPCVALAFRAERAAAAPEARSTGDGPALEFATALRFAERSGGKARADSEGGRSAAVTLVLPLAPEPAAKEDRAEQSGGAGGGETILVVEDEPLVRDLVVAQLRRLGYAVLEAHDGPSALAEIERNARIDLVFSDLVMPGGMSGFALADAARRIRPALRFLFTTGYSDEEATTRSSAKGPEILRKPYELKELAQRVRKALAQPRP